LTFSILFKLFLQFFAESFSKLFIFLWFEFFEEVSPKEHFLNARTNITLNNDVEGRGMMVAMENTVSYDGDNFEILFLTLLKVSIFQRGLFLIITDSVRPDFFFVINDNLSLIDHAICRFHLVNTMNSYLKLQPL